MAFVSLSAEQGAESKMDLLTRNQGWARHWEVLGRALEEEEKQGGLVSQVVPCQGGRSLGR